MESNESQSEMSQPLTPEAKPEVAASNPTPQESEAPPNPYPYGEPQFLIVTYDAIHRLKIQTATKLEDAFKKLQREGTKGVVIHGTELKFELPLLGIKVGERNVIDVSPSWVLQQLAEEHGFELRERDS